MYCADGVWLSVTPTDDELIVALDFEGRADFFWSGPIDDTTKFQA
jgi:hypothetical protein